MKKPIIHERLTELVSYDPETGLFTWLVDKIRAKKGYLAGVTRPDGYIKIGLDGERYLAHRLAWFYIHGVWPSYDIDHINGDRNDNSEKNLRCATRAQNLQNSRRPNGRTSGFRGVYWSEQKQAWKVQIRVNGSALHIGLFKDKQAAISASIEAREKYHGVFANHG